MSWGQRAWSPERAPVAYVPGLFFLLSEVPGWGVWSVAALRLSAIALRRDPPGSAKFRCGHTQPLPYTPRLRILSILRGPLPTVAFPQRNQNGRAARDRSMHSILKLFTWSGRRWSGGRERNRRRPQSLSVERYGADLLEPRRMMAVVGLPDEPAANVSVAAGWAAAASASATSDFTYTTSNGQAAITGYIGNDTAVVVPGMIDGLAVASIAPQAFNFRKDLTSIIIPDGVVSIGTWAFMGCTSLASVALPSGLKSIGLQSFSFCTSLASVGLPLSLTSIGNGAFSSCTRLTSIALPASLTSIGIAAFSRCTSLTSIAVASDNSSFKSVDGVLYDKQGATLICYPGGKQGPFAVPQGVTSIGDSAFSDCTNLTGVTLPAGLTDIGVGSFSGCNSLSSIAIPAGLTRIGSGAFSRCTSLTSIAVASDNSSFKSVDGVLYDKQGATLICYPGGKQGHFAVPLGVTSIGDNAFSSSTGLTSIAFPTSLKSIGYWAFNYCITLTSITFPAGLTNIGASSFSGCYSLTSIVIPASVNAIGDYAFNGCQKLAAITFLGDAPQLAAGSTIFLAAGKTTAYYLPGRRGWLSQFGGIPTAPISLPSVPGSLSAVRGNTAATLTWATPAFDGHAPISDHVIQYRKTSSPVWSTFQHVSSAATTVVTGLANRQAYVFRVAAVNALGQGSWSTQSSAVIPLPPPSAPGRPVGAAGNGVVSLRFAAPQATGGLRVTDYVIQYSANSGVSWTTAADSVSPLTTATVRGLSNGTSYVFRVAAVTTGGTGAFSVSSAQVIPYLRTAMPAAPTSVTGVGSSGTVSLTWAASSSHAGGPIRDYVIQYRSAAAGSRWLAYTDGVTSANAATVRRLVAGRSYIFRVAAKNLAGQGAFSSPSDVIRA